MKKLLLLIVLTLALALGETNESKSINRVWIKKESKKEQFPESPTETFIEETATPDNNSETSDDITTKKPSEAILRQEVKSEDLSVGYTPGYCRCVSRHYCSGPNQQRLRSVRAVNTPPCTGRNEVMCCLTNGPGCGVPGDFPYFNPYPLYGEANFADHPWLALVIDEDGKAIYGHGVTIAWRVVLTTARNVAEYKNKRFRVRLGEWDISNDDEPFKALEFDVSEVIIHPKYDARTFQNDIAILKLASSVDLASFPNIRSACLARPNDSQRFRNAKCLVAGWGFEPTQKLADKQVPPRVIGNHTNTRISRNILKEVDMQILDERTCQDAIRKSINNPQYYFDTESFICAGGEKGKGLCKGDEGAALVCQDGPLSRYTFVGMASWGTTCGQQGFPAVFTNMETYYNWIRSVTPDIGQ